MAAKVGLVKPQDHIVCVQRMGESFVIKIVSVNDSGDGVEMIRPKSLINLIRVSPLPSPLPPPSHILLFCPLFVFFLHVLLLFSSSVSALLFLASILVLCCFLVSLLIPCCLLFQFCLLLSF